MSSSRSMASAGSPMYLPYLVNFIWLCPSGACPCWRHWLRRTSCRFVLRAETKFAQHVLLPVLAARSSLSSIVIAARPGDRLARLRRALLFGIEAAFFAAANAPMRPKTFQNHFGGCGGVAFVFAIDDAEARDVVHQALHFAKLLNALASGAEVRNFQFTAGLEPLDCGLEVDFGEVLRKNAADGGADEFTGDDLGTFELAFILKLHFASDGRQGGVKIGDAGDDVCFPGADGVLLGAADHAFKSADGQALADAGAAVHALVFAGLEGDLLDDFAKILRDLDFDAGVAGGPGLLGSDGDAFVDRRGIVGANFRADAVFQRRDDFPARSVVFGICGKDDKHVEREAERVALNLDVALLHDVEQTDLNFSSKVGKFVDGEDAAIGAGQEAVVNGEFVGEVAGAAGGANGVDVAYDVGHRYIRRG